MWTLYGGGLEGVAIRSTERKLRKLIEHNTSFLEQKGLEARVTDVQYVEGLQVPTEDALQRVFNLLTDAEVSVGVFGLKPSLYEYEQEVRTIISPKRSIFEPVRNPYPELCGFSLPIGERAKDSESTVTALVDAVYIHPTLGPNSMVYRVVSELNRHFHMAEMVIVADPVEPKGM